MKLRFKQRLFSWLDSYDVFDERGEVAYTVKGRLALGHKLEIQNAEGEHIATLKEVLLTFLKPKFEMYEGEHRVGTITKEITLFKPKFILDCNGWQVTGSFWEWDYSIVDADGRTVALITKELWNFTDTYALDIIDPADALQVLMVVLAIDAEKCSRQ
ncbi:MAG: LURP-one-related family protein [Clostridia bacterium]|nr:LURP-one-related family protein [Clostridia bacterium]